MSHPGRSCPLCDVSSYLFLAKISNTSSKSDIGSRQSSRGFREIFKLAKEISPPIMSKYRNGGEKSGRGGREKNAERNRTAMMKNKLDELISFTK